MSEQPPTPSESPSPPPVTPQPIASSTEEADNTQLRVLSILHYVAGGLALAGMCFGVLYGAMGAFFLSDTVQSQTSGDPPPEAIGWFMLILGGAGVVFALIAGTLTILSGRWIMERRNRIGSMIIAGFWCLSIPLGTALGVYTFIVLSRPGVIEQYRRTAATGGRGG